MEDDGETEIRENLLAGKNDSRRGPRSFKKNVLPGGSYSRGTAGVYYPKGIAIQLLVTK
jgi:hypothetical protein